MRGMLSAALVAALIFVTAPDTVAEDAADAWQVRPALVGTTIPDVSFVGEDNVPISVRELAKEKPLVLIVYRGLW
jgi:hypothetical protein